MTAIMFDGSVRWYWATTVASTSAPTVANIAAATRLVRWTGYDVPSSEAEVDVSDADTLYDTNIIGTTKVGPIVITFKVDDPIGSDTMWTLFNTPKTVGFLLRSANGTVTATSKIEVYPAQYGQRRLEGYARNTAQKFAVSFGVTSAPNLDATIAA